MFLNLLSKQVVARWAAWTGGGRLRLDFFTLYPTAHTLYSSQKKIFLFKCLRGQDHSILPSRLAISFLIPFTQPVLFPSQVSFCSISLTLQISSTHFLHSLSSYIADSLGKGVHDIQTVDSIFYQLFLLYFSPMGLRDSTIPILVFIALLQCFIWKSSYEFGVIQSLEAEPATFLHLPSCLRPPAFAIKEIVDSVSSWKSSQCCPSFHTIFPQLHVFTWLLQRETVH
jgi:hypothetical protein